MPMSTLHTVMIAAGAGAVAGIFAALLLTSPAAELEAGSGSPDNTAFVNRIHELEQQNIELSSRVALLEDLPVAVERKTDGPTREEYEALVAQVAGASGNSEAITATPTGQGFDGAVTAVIEQREQTLQEKKEQEAAMHRASSVQRTADYWQDQLGLDQAQGEALYDLLLARTEGHVQLKRDWQAGGDTEVLGETKATIEDDFNSGMGNLLTPVQLETYNAGNSKKR